MASFLDDSPDKKDWNVGRVSKSLDALIGDDEIGDVFVDRKQVL